MPSWKEGDPRFESLASSGHQLHPSPSASCPLVHLSHLGRLLVASQPGVNSCSPGCALPAVDQLRRRRAARVSLLQLAGCAALQDCRCLAGLSKLLLLRSLPLLGCLPCPSAFPARFNPA